MSDDDRLIELLYVLLRELFIDLLFKVLLNDFKGDVFIS